MKCNAMLSAQQLAVTKIMTSVLKSRRYFTAADLVLLN